METKKDNDFMEKIHGLVGPATKARLEEISDQLKLRVSLLVAIAIDNELRRDYPFIYNVDDPELDLDPDYFPYANDCSKLLNFLRANTGKSLEMLCTIRHDIGIPDREIFLAVFHELLKKEMIEEYRPKKTARTFDYKEDFRFYRIKGGGRKEVSKVNREAKRFERYTRDKKKFEGM